jgi:hypothetical protein
MLLQCLLLLLLLLLLGQVLKSTRMQLSHQPYAAAAAPVLQGTFVDQLLVPAGKGFSLLLLLLVVVAHTPHHSLSS